MQLDLPLNTVAVECSVIAATESARVCTDPTEQDDVSMQAIAARKKPRAQPVTYITSGMSKIRSANIVDVNQLILCLHQAKMPSYIFQQNNARRVR